MLMRLAPIILACGSCAVAPTNPTTPQTQTTPLMAETWDNLCDAPSTPIAVYAPAPEGGAHEWELEPSAAVVVGWRVIVIGDKQPFPWSWVPGTTALTPDPTPAPHALVPSSCCAVADDGHWSAPIKKTKANETCAVHGVSPDAPLAWLKGEGVAAIGDTVYVAGNMGFGCAENDVTRLSAAGAEPVPGLGRDAVMAALTATDVRVEGFALADGGAIALFAIRERNDAPVRTILVAARGPAGDYTFQAPVSLDGDFGTLALSDISVAPDGRALLTLSDERIVDGVQLDSGVALVSEDVAPWTRPGPWRVRRLLTQDGHKPEAIVALSPKCAAVFYDDDSKVKRQQRERDPGPQWAPRAAFVSYVRF